MRSRNEIFDNLSNPSRMQLFPGNTIGVGPGIDLLTLITIELLLDLRDQNIELIELLKSKK